MRLTYKTFILLFLSVAILYLIQYYFFKLQLNYGFRDGDWFILYNFKTFGENPITHLVNSIKAHGIYTYQIYYIGFLEYLVGLNFVYLHFATHIFKFIASLTFGFSLFFITRRLSLAGLWTFFYIIAPATAGAMYMVVTGAYFIAILSMSIFILFYWELIKAPYLKLKNLFLTTMILYLTIILNPERMYPLLIIIFIIEMYLMFNHKEQRKKVKMRLIFFFVPIFVTLFLYLISSLSSSKEFQFSPFQLIFPNTRSRIELVSNGNWQLLIYPFTSLGSLVLPKEYWSILSLPTMFSFVNFMGYYLTKIIPAFIPVTLILTLLVSKKMLNHTFKIIIIFSLGNFIFYILSSHWYSVIAEKRIHFDPNTVLPAAFIGLYIVIMSIYFFIQRKYFKEQLFFAHFLYIAPLFAIIFIFTTWIPSDEVLLFTGAQRYLTIPALGMSVFLACVIVLLYIRFNKPFQRPFFLLLICLIIYMYARMNYVSINNFFYDELYFGGLDGKQQTIMKNKFWSIATNINDTEPSLFYFDETESGEYGYFNESTVIAGISDWVRFQGSEAIKTRPIPGVVRTNVNCLTRTHQGCVEKIKQNLVLINGKLFIKHRTEFSIPEEDRYYSLDNFYAIKFINKELVDIKQEVLKELEKR